MWKNSISHNTLRFVIRIQKSRHASVSTSRTVEEATCKIAYSYFTPIYDPVIN